MWAASNDKLPWPTFAQTSIKKSFDLRVTCIGTDCFGVGIKTDDSSDIDTRKQWVDAEHFKCDVRPELKEKLQAFLIHYGLNYGAFDFAVDSFGNEWFLECNPLGQFLWLDYKLNLGLADVMALYLTGEGRTLV